LATAAPEDVEIAGVGIAFQSLLNLKRETLHAAPHVRVTRRDPNARTAGNRDQDRSAFNAAAINGSLADALMLTRAPSARSTTIAWRFPFLRHRHFVSPSHRRGDLAWSKGRR
jgi:hypothetical protein